MLFTLRTTALVITILITLLACSNDSGGPITGNLFGTSDIDSDNDGLIEIRTLEQLDWIRNDLQGTSLVDNDGNVTTDGCPNIGCNGYELVADLDFDTNSDGKRDSADAYYDYDKDGSNNGWLPIGTISAPFASVFEGNGHHIRNLYINRLASDTETSGNYIGLFGAISGRTVTNGIEIRNTIISGPLTEINGDLYTGGLIGSAQEKVSIRNCLVTGIVTGLNYTGGLIGSLNYNAVSIAACTTCEVSNSLVIATIKGNNTTGGLIGAAANAIINNTFASGDINTNVTNASNIGGLLGVAYTNASINHSIAVNSVVGTTQTGALIGASTNASYSATYFANDNGQTNALGSYNGTTTSLNPTGTTGANLVTLQADTNLYTNWDNSWDFGTTSQLPGLIINTTLYRDGDANGALD